ncbi:hypothetical protein J5N97_013006 [Dioscorea zingiberensis]|uniref:Uncharacterized protein n=1 Tax=Dioscorea zingiberensis TaxID=325984 RepID=A0A9D5CS52_9LILI|nr:hypothetical protein J5N97_013006 [Dioscorea zingiberensis]
MSRHRRQASQALPANLDVTDDVPLGRGTTTSAHEFSGAGGQALAKASGDAAGGTVDSKTKMASPEALPRLPTTLDSKKKASASDP